jgi:hypothetical protein
MKTYTITAKGTKQLEEMGKKSQSARVLASIKKEPKTSSELVKQFARSIPKANIFWYVSKLKKFGAIKASSKKAAKVAKAVVSDSL